MHMICGGIFSLGSCSFQWLRNGTSLGHDQLLSRRELYTLDSLIVWVECPVVHQMEGVWG